MTARNVVPRSQGALFLEDGNRVIEPPRRARRCLAEVRAPWVVRPAATSSARWPETAPRRSPRSQAFGGRSKDGRQQRMVDRSQRRGDVRPDQHLVPHLVVGQSRVRCRQSQRRLRADGCFHITPQTPPARRSSTSEANRRIQAPSARLSMPDAATGDVGHVQGMRLRPSGLLTPLYETLIGEVLQRLQHPMPYVPLRCIRPLTTTIDFSTSSAEADQSAGPEQPDPRTRLRPAPARTRRRIDNRSNSRCSGSSSRRYDQSTTARRLRCRSSAVRRPRSSRSSRPPDARSLTTSMPSVDARAAASSKASGRPSRPAASAAMRSRSVLRDGCRRPSAGQPIEEEADCRRVDVGGGCQRLERHHMLAVDAEPLRLVARTCPGRAPTIS